jgi:uncharacterized membrane protein YgaE (UPF0421/DUF939 family)
MEIQKHLSLTMHNGLTEVALLLNDLSHQKVLVAVKNMESEEPAIESELSYEDFENQYLNNADHSSASANVLSKGFVKLRDGSISTFEKDQETKQVKLITEDGRVQTITLEIFTHLLNDKHFELD